MKLDSYLTACTEINSVWLKNRKIRAKTLALLEENMGVNLCDLGFSSCFLDMTPKAQATQEKVDKLDFIKHKTFCVSKDTMKKLKRQPTEWEKHICKLYLQKTSNVQVI